MAWGKLHAISRNQGSRHTRIQEYLETPSKYSMLVQFEARSRERLAILPDTVTCSRSLQHTACSLHWESGVYENYGWAPPEGGFYLADPAGQGGISHFLFIFFLFLLFLLFTIFLFFLCFPLCFYSCFLFLFICFFIFHIFFHFSWNGLQRQPEKVGPTPTPIRKGNPLLPFLSLPLPPPPTPTPEGQPSHPNREGEAPQLQEGKAQSNHKKEGPNSRAKTHKRKNEKKKWKEKWKENAKKRKIKI